MTLCFRGAKVAAGERTPTPRGVGGADWDDMGRSHEQLCIVRARSAVWCTTSCPGHAKRTRRGGTSNHTVSQRNTTDDIAYCVATPLSHAEREAKQKRLRMKKITHQVAWIAASPTSVLCSNADGNTLKNDWITVFFCADPQKTLVLPSLLRYEEVQASEVS